MGPNTAFCFFAAGFLGVYGELIWPARVWPSVAGLGAALVGGYWLWRASPTPLGLGVLTVALLLFLLDAFAETLNIAGISATAAMALGFARLLAGPHRLQPVLAIPACLGFGAITLVLNRAAKQARRNKLADLYGERKGRG
jgi:membrane-bound ClpP family serine protease